MSDGTSVRRLWNTVRHLRAHQLASQIGHRARPLWERPARFAGREVPDYPGVRWRPRAPFLGPGRPVAPTLEDGTFTFLNDTRRAGWPPQWQGLEAPRLWLYNLHYFEWLWRLDADAARDVATHWMEHHPLGPGRVGWEPYPISLRLMTWLALFLGRDREIVEADSRFREALWRSVFLQAQWLAAHLERHLMGNHLFENGAALLFAGSCFDGPEARRWYGLGERLLAEQVREQFLDDGLHFERSPMYHLRAVYVLLLLANIRHPAAPPWLRPVLERALEAATRLVHPDGAIALLNDSAFGVYNSCSELLKTASRVLERPAPIPEEGCWALPRAGYYGLRHADNYLVCDAGEIGPDYIPGHAHGDIFSFELSLGGHRVIVDGGVHDYEVSEMRRYCRSTRAHNTVEIDGQDQCEFWGAFRVARRGRPRDVAWAPDAEGFRLSGWHDGYLRLPGRPRHDRDFRADRSGRLEVQDLVTASRPVRSVSRLHLHPDCTVEAIEQNRCTVVHPGGSLRVEFRGEGRLETEDAWYCPEFGKRIASTALAFTSRGSELRTGFLLEPAREP